MTLIKASKLAAYNKSPYQVKNFRLELEPPRGFSAGDYVPLIVYNAFVGSDGKGMRSVAQKTRARLFSDHAVLDEYDPLMNLSLTPDGHPLFELVGYLIDSNEEEHLFFTLKIKKNESKPKRLYPSDEFPVGSSQLVRIYKGRTPKKLGQKIAELTVLITEQGMTLPSHTLPSFNNPITGEVLFGEELTYWLVGPDNKEYYVFSGTLTPKEIPSLQSLLEDPPESVN